MRTGVDAPTLALYTGQRFDLHVRIKVANGSGTLIDLFGRYKAYNVQYPNPNLPIAGLTVDFIRETTQALSLAPFVQASSYNRLDDGVTFSPLLQIGRLVTWEFALTAELGARPADGSALWFEGFRGTIASVKWPQRYGRTASISCTDMGGLLQKSKSEAEYTYTAGTSIESAIQQVFSNNGHTVTFSAPVATGKVLANDYAPGLQKTVWEQAWALAQSIGWLGWFRYSGNSTLAYTLFEPSRSKTVPDQTISLIHDFTDFGIEESDIRNVGYIRYYDALGIQQSIGPMEDAPSIATYGGIRRAFWISLPLESPVRDSTAATAMLTAALADVADPDVVATVTLPPMVFADAANDLYDFPILDGRLFDVAQTGAPFAVEIKQTGDQSAESSLPIRGRPSAGSRTWTSKHSTGITSVGGGVLYDVRAPFANTLTVDGTGDDLQSFGTIQEAIDAAVIRGATADNWWQVEILNGKEGETYGFYTEDIEIFGGVHVKGAGKLVTRILGTVTIHAGGSIEDCYLDAGDGDTETILCVADDTETTMIQSCYIRNDQAADFQLTGIRQTGTATAPIAYIEDCYIYVRNPWSGAFTNAACVIGEVDATVAQAHMEFRRCHFKTSVPLNNAIPVTAAKVRGSGSNVSIMIERCGWEAYHTGITVAPKILDSTNTSSTANVVDLSVTTPYGDITAPTWNSSSASSTARHFPAQIYRYLSTIEDLSVGRTLSLTDGTASHLLAGRSYFGTLSDVAYLERSGVGVLQTGAHLAAASLGVGAVTVLTAARVLQNVTANASILNVGNLAYARLPTGGGTWDAGAATVTLLGSLSASGGITAGGAATALAFIPTTGGSLAAGRIVRRADLGMVIYGSGGSSRCFALLNDTGSSVMSVTPGSLMLRTDSDLLVGRNLLLGSAGGGGGVGVFSMLNATTEPTLSISGAQLWAFGTVLKTDGIFDALGGLKVNGNAVVSAAGKLDPGSFETIGNIGSTIGLFGSAGTVKQTVTGSKAGNAALASLIAVLAGHGLLTDSTT